jgi:hypothetical protein
MRFTAMHWCRRSVLALRMSALLLGRVPTFFSLTQDARSEVLGSEHAAGGSAGRPGVAGLERLPCFQSALRTIENNAAGNDFAVHGSSPRFRFGGRELVPRDGAIACLRESQKRLSEHETRLLRLSVGQIAHGRLPAVASRCDLRLAQSALLNVCDD